MTDPIGDYEKILEHHRSGKSHTLEALLKEFSTGDRVTLPGVPRIVWVIASIDSSGNAQLRAGDTVGFAPLSNLQHYRTNNAPTDTPVRQRDVTEF